jgi:hypothetical protein
MTQFHEGQEVEVWITTSFLLGWHKAKIIAWPHREADRWRVQFPDGRCVVFNTENIREVVP